MYKKSLHLFKIVTKLIPTILRPEPFAIPHLELNTKTGRWYKRLNLPATIPKTPKCQFLLVDSINKKINVVNAISESLNLRNVSSLVSRVEHIKSKHDFIVSRAVTKMKKFRNLVKGKISSNNTNVLNNGIIYLKGGDLKEEMMNISHQIFNISDYFTEDFFDTKKIVYLEG